MYRDGISVIQSFARLTHINAALTFKLCLVLPNISKGLARWMHCQNESPCMEPEWFETGCVSRKHALMWIMACHNYMRHRQQGLKIAGFRYEDFVANPLRNGQALFRYLDLPEQWAEKALPALDIDSQRASPISREALAGKGTWTLSAQDRIWIDRVCERYGVPSIMEKCVLENTISN